MHNVIDYSWIGKNEFVLYKNGQTLISIVHGQLKMIYIVLKSCSWVSMATNDGVHT